MTPSPLPAGYTTVTPWVISRDTAALIDFVVEAFDGDELGRVVDEDGAIGHAEIRIGDAVVMAFDARPEWPPTPACLRVFVEDGDAVFDRALDAGAAPVTEMTELFFGDRVGRVRDPQGHLWWIQQHLEDLTAQEMVRRAALPEYQAAMAYVQGADLFAPVPVG